MSSHAKNAKKSLEDFTAAVASGDEQAAQEALAEAMMEGACCTKASGTRAASAADADVLAACDTALSTVQTVTRSATPATVGASNNVWDLFLQLAPTVLEWLKARFGGP